MASPLWIPGVGPIWSPATGGPITATPGVPCECCEIKPTCAVPSRTLTITVTVTVPGSCCVADCNWCLPGCEILDCCTREMKAFTFTQTAVIPANLFGGATARWTRSLPTTAEQEVARICRARSETAPDITGFCPPSGGLIQVALPCTCGQGCCITYMGTMSVGVNLLLNCSGSVATWTGGVGASLNLRSRALAETGGGCVLGPPGAAGSNSQVALDFDLPVETAPNGPPTSKTLTANVNGGSHENCSQSGFIECPDVTAEATFTLVWS